MIVVIQCAASKQPHAGTLHTRDGRRVAFVAQPALAPRSAGVAWARPDDAADAERGGSWRDLLQSTNATRNVGSGLLRAFELYQPAAFGRLARRFGHENLFILSAGWGLVRAGFRLPSYDITFSKQAEPYKRRQVADRYEDFNQLAPAPPGPVVFLGGRDYLPLFAELTRGVQAPIVIPFRSDPADASACSYEDGHLRFVPYATTAKTNWHYGCAERLCDDPSFLERVR